MPPSRCSSRPTMSTTCSRAWSCSIAMAGLRPSPTPPATRSRRPSARSPSTSPTTRRSATSSAGSAARRWNSTPPRRWRARSWVLRSGGWRPARTRRSRSSSSRCSPPKGCGRSRSMRSRGSSSSMPGSRVSSRRPWPCSHWPPITRRRGWPSPSRARGRGTWSSATCRSRRSGRRATGSCSMAMRRRRRPGSRAGRSWKTRPTPTGETCGWRWSAAGRSRL